MQSNNKKTDLCDVKISIPFPERTLFLRELNSDMQDHFEQLIAAGKDPDSAMLEVKKLFHFNTSDLTALHDAHKNILERWISNIPIQTRKSLSDALCFTLAFAFITTLVKEVPMIQFLNEGGVIIYAILSIGGAVLLMQFVRCFNWFIRRDHSDDSLAANSSTPIVAVAVLGFVGILGTAIGYYVVFQKWANHAISDAEFKIGLYEPLPCLIVAMLLGTTILTIHWATQSRLRAIGIN